MKAFALAALLIGACHASADITVRDDADQIDISTTAIAASIRKKGYVSGVAGGSFVDRKTGFHDAGFGLDIVDWLMEPGSDAVYRDKLPGDLPYDYNNLVHGSRAKRSIEGPQICTQAKELSPRVIHGKDFVAITMDYTYRLAAPGKNTGSRWSQTLVFPEGKRYFLSADRIDPVNASDAMFLRLDMPGHIRHSGGDTFSEVYLSYHGRIPASEFNANFAPDTKFLYARDDSRLPKRFIRAYHLRDPKTGKDGPWLAGMTLDPSVMSEAWCHQRDYVCLIEEIGGRKTVPGKPFGAAYLVGYFDSIPEMERTYDQYAGHVGLTASESGWKLTKSLENRKSKIENSLSWFQDQKFGLFLHWGIYSQWGCIESWPLVEEDKWARPDDLKAWTDRGKDMARFKADYRALKYTFNPTRFDPAKWAEAAKYAGMKYVVFTTKHHDGFSMFDTKQTDFRITAPDCPFSSDPRSNVAREVFNTFRAKGFGIGAYFSKADWNHPDYWSPDAPARTRNPNYDTLRNPEKWARFVDFTHRQIEELMTGYGKVDILWLDAGQVRPPLQDIQMDRLAAMARSHQPDLLIVDRTVGGKYEDYRTPEQEVPDKPLPYVWESCITMGTQWSNKPNDQYKSARSLIHLLVDVVAKGGNLLLNIGPQPDGQLPEVALSRLKEIGDWMQVNGQAIHGTRAIAPYKEGRIAFTRKGKAVYAIVLDEEGNSGLPRTVTLSSICPKASSRVRMLGARESLAWKADGKGGCVITVPASLAQYPPTKYATALRIDPTDK
jgi:alpha-L-fucosidase